MAEENLDHTDKDRHSTATSERDQTTTDISRDVDTQELIRSSNQFNQNQQDLQTLAENQQRLTLQAQLNNSFASLQAALSAQLVKMVTDANTHSHDINQQTIRCNNHSEEQIHDTLQEDDSGSGGTA